VLLLSFFRAGPGTWMLWRLREQRKAGIGEGGREGGKEGMRMRRKVGREKNMKGREDRVRGREGRREGGRGGGLRQAVLALMAHTYISDLFLPPSLPPSLPP